MTKSSVSKKKKTRTAGSSAEDVVVLEDQPELDTAVVDEALVLDDEAVETDDVVEDVVVPDEVAPEVGEKASRAKPKDETVLRQWCITGVSIDGKKVVLGKYYTESEATPDRDRIVADGFYHDVRVSAIPVPPQA